MTLRIALIGLGEVGRILAEDLPAKAARLSAWDLKFADTASGPSQTASTLALHAASSAHEAVKDCDLIISAVTAAQTLSAAQSVTGGLKPGAIFLDLNSASPGAKQQAAQVIESVGGRYVEAAVMSPVPPKRIATPILLGGPHAASILPLAHDLGFAATSVFSTELGKASAAKMCRSVMVKGIEALLSESLLAARAYGVEDTVLKSLDDLFPGPDWPTLSRYMISRTLEHGTRRAEEMREVARTVREVGVYPYMSAATAERQDWASWFSSALQHEDLKLMLDAIGGAKQASADEHERQIPIWFSTAETEAAARALDAAGRFYRWWPETIPPFDELDPIGRSEFLGCVEDILKAAAKARPPTRQD